MVSTVLCAAVRRATPFAMKVERLRKERIAAGLISPENDEVSVLISTRGGPLSGDLAEIPAPPTCFKTRKSINSNRPTIHQIQAHVCAAFGVTIDEMLARRNNAEFLVPRIIAMFLSKKLTLYSFPEIGREFAKRDHTTILSGVRRAQKHIRDDDKFAELVERLGAEIIINRNLSFWQDKMQVSDASQLAALQTAKDIAAGRVKLNAAQRELWEMQIDAIRQRVIDAAARRETKTEGAR